MNFVILMKKVDLGNSTFVFIPLEVAKGELSEDAKIFTDLNGQKYTHIVEKDVVEKDNILCFGFPFKAQNFIKKGLTDEEIIKKSYKEFSNCIYIGIYHEEKDKVIIYPTNKKEFENKYNNSLSEKDDEKVTQIITSTFDEIINIINIYLNKDKLTEEDKKEINYLIDHMLNFLTGKETINYIHVNAVSEETYLNLTLKITLIIEDIIVKFPDFSLEGKSFAIINTNNKKLSQPSIIKNENSIVNNYSVDDISNKIKEVVIGQDEHIDRIVIQLYKRLIQMDLPQQLRGNFGMLVTGSTGVGKTEILETFSEIVDLPFLKIDSTQLTKPGYVGKNIEDYLYELYEQEHGDMKRIEKAIVIFDEIDKKASDDNQDVAGKAVLDVLLKFLDGTSYRLGRDIQINTKNMTAISLGAFSGLFSKKVIGINQTNQIIEPTLNDYIKYGMTAEYMGRNPIRIHLNDLSVTDLENILRMSKKSPLVYQRAIYEQLGIDLIIDDDYYKKAALKVSQYGIGARALTDVVESTTYLPIIDINRHKGEYNKLILTGETIDNPKIFTLRRD